MVTDPNIRELVINSLEIGVMVTIMTSIVSLPLAYFLTRYRFPGRDMLRAVILIPMIMPPFVGAIGMQQFFGLFGSVNMLLVKLNLIDISETIDWFRGGFWGVVMLSTLHLYPIMYLNIVAALANVDPSLEEAAENMGASRFQVFRQITLPLMMPGYFAGAILVFIWAFTDLGTPLIFNYNEVVAVRIFRQVTEANQNPMGYALVVLIIVLTALAFYVSKRWTGSKHYEMLGRGHVTSREVDTKWAMRSIIYLFIGGLTFMALLPHISVILISLTPDASQWRLSVLPQSFTFAALYRDLHAFRYAAEYSQQPKIQRFQYTVGTFGRCCGVVSTHSQTPAVSKSVGCNRDVTFSIAGRCDSIWIYGQLRRYDAFIETSSRDIHQCD